MPATAPATVATVATVAAVNQAFERRELKYRRLVIATADGTQEFDPDEVVELAESMGKTAHEFQEDVERVGARREADRRLKDVPALRKAATDAENAMRAARAEFEAHALAYHNKRTALESEMNRCVVEANARENEHRRAFEKCPYPEIEAEYQAALRHRLRLDESLSALARSANQLQAQIDRAESLHAQRVVTPNLDLISMRADLADAEAQIYELKAEKVEADAEVERVGALRLVP